LAQHPDQNRVANNIIALNDGYWKSPAYFQFVSSENANQPGASWQHKKCICVESESWGDIVIDVLKEDIIGGFEFVRQADQTDCSAISLDGSIDISFQGRRVVGSLLNGRVKTGDTLLFATQSALYKRVIVGVDFMHQIGKLKAAKLVLTLFDFPKDDSDRNVQISPQIGLIIN
ncbi:MAG TPA: hypothetical protein VK616_20400, partial [Flavitalea sp.]|nr:hypothetical protein [Flavitalea sp.]